MTYLFFGGSVRAEDDPSVIANLTRKGWELLPEPPSPSATWIGGQWVEPPAPEPEPQWLTFGAAVTADPAINQLLGTALTMAPAVAMSLSVGLGKAADGDSRVFLQAWGAAQSLGLVGAELAMSVAATAKAHDLPADFVAALQP